MEQIILPHTNEFRYGKTGKRRLTYVTLHLFKKEIPPTPIQRNKQTCSPVPKVIYAFSVPTENIDYVHVALVFFRACLNYLFRSTSRS